MAALSPGSTIGIFGSGQLGRMLTSAAANLGFKTIVLSPDENSPAGQISAGEIIAPYDDLAAIRKLGSLVDVATYEFENIPAEATFEIEKAVSLHPSTKALSVSQDRWDEKTFLNEIGERTAPFAKVDTLEDLRTAVKTIGLPAVLKTRRFGYDGKGQTLLRTPEDLKGALDIIGNAPAILEGFIDFTCEISVIVARDQNGKAAAYDPGENIHRNHILSSTIVPARIPSALATRAREKAIHIAGALDYVGVMGVEMFVTADEHLLINEIAPRVHNSGHWTIDACATSQFEQHIRAICGWPLGSVERHSDAVMHNLVGEEFNLWPELAAKPNVCLHLYGKETVRKGRKMAHLTQLRPLGSEAPEGEPDLR